MAYFKVVSLHSSRRAGESIREPVKRNRYSDRDSKPAPPEYKTGPEFPQLYLPVCIKECGDYIRRSSSGQQPPEEKTSLPAVHTPLNPTFGFTIFFIDTFRLNRLWQRLYSTLVLGRSLIQISAMTPATYTEDSYGFLQAFQENIGIQPRLGHHRFLQTHVLFISHTTLDANCPQHRQGHEIILYNTLRATVWQ